MQCTIPKIFLEVNCYLTNFLINFIKLNFIKIIGIDIISLYIYNDL